MGNSFNKEIAKNNAHASVIRLKRMCPSKQEECARLRNDIAGLLQTGKVENGRIRAESFLNQTKKAELLEVLELMCEKVEMRIDFIDQNKEIPPDMTDVISGIIYAANFMSIEYLTELSKQLIYKYGSEYGKNCQAGIGVNPNFVAKFSASIPSGQEISMTLLNIATEHRISSYLNTFAYPAFSPIQPLPVVNEDPGPYSQNRVLPSLQNSNPQQPPPYLCQGAVPSQGQGQCPSVTSSSFSHPSFSPPTLRPPSSQFINFSPPAFPPSSLSSPAANADSNQPFPSFPPSFQPPLTGTDNANTNANNNQPFTSFPPSFQTLPVDADNGNEFPSPPNVSFPPDKD